MANRFAVHELGGTWDDENGAFMDTAAVMKNLDLVITSDTAAAHLAGALGVTVWVALSAVARLALVSGSARTLPGIRRCDCFASRAGRLERGVCRNGRAVGSQGSRRKRLIDVCGDLDLKAILNFAWQPN